MGFSWDFHGGFYWSFTGVQWDEKCETSEATVAAHPRDAQLNPTEFVAN